MEKLSTIKRRYVDIEQCSYGELQLLQELLSEEISEWLGDHSKPLTPVFIFKMYLWLDCMRAWKERFLLLTPKI